MPVHLLGWGCLMRGGWLQNVGLSSIGTRRIYLAQIALMVVLDHLQDPNNLGAIIRTAEAVGCAGVCIPRRRAAAVTPAVVRASAGATEHVPVFRVGNISRTIERLKRVGYWAVALDSAGDQHWDQVDYSTSIALVVGAEGKGLHRLVLNRCDHRVALPMLGDVASLNVSVAFAVVA
ncbi:MAG: 23S rRNA (guanosine(2251)-2'-O)-methyltransferase RlmB [Acidobacteriota bacterium]